MKGCCIYNTDKNLNKGDIIVARRPSKKRDGSLYKPCLKCRGFFSASSLQRHYANCRKTIVKGERTEMVESRKILAKLCLKYKAKYNHKIIRAKLRLLGRLIYEMKKINKLDTNFSSIYTPELYDSFVAAVNLLGEQSSDGTTYNKPAVPSAIGIEIKKVARLLIALDKKMKMQKRCGIFLRAVQ
ncbi:hypothetical protein WA026_014216 [Henosepilachna vigintioctopunctata]|uniref:Uncharacterized protein n=1 Tax=Henosepilachna vigintioctopunctata TaxID=420089 RepID=A0AAW1TUD8_9CUCU